MKSSPSSHSSRVYWWAIWLADWFDGTPRQWVMLFIAKKYNVSASVYVPTKYERMLMRLVPWLGHPILFRHFSSRVPELAPFVQDEETDWRSSFHSLEMPCLIGVLLGVFIAFSHLTDGARMGLVSIALMLVLVMYTFHRGRQLHRNYQRHVEGQLSLVTEGPEALWENATSLEDGLKQLLPPASVTACMRGIETDPSYWMTLEGLPSLKKYRPIASWPWVSLVVPVLIYFVLVWLITEMMVLPLPWRILPILLLGGWSLILPRPWWPSQTYWLLCLGCASFGGIASWLASLS
ncbi:hypothetical protein LIN78_11180 [Leeia sp. TBRC 13508]|uniref:Uncharacterized protein n=1 Tax=Leeia speluncae TaxID=2884804 RepID=A0ABS8D7T8_9NEIS|nr:hypothetical protein [Leeia speluncae]MCB6184108.1 hypothetical protein [Leeia speluncae]